MKCFALLSILLVTAMACADGESDSFEPLFDDEMDSCQDCCINTPDPKRKAQTYTYYQNTGRFTGGDGSWSIATTAYSGAGEGLNNPDK